MLVELGFMEQRHKAVMEVLDGATVTDVVCEGLFDNEFNCPPRNDPTAPAQT